MLQCLQGVAWKSQAAGSLAADASLTTYAVPPPAHRCKKANDPNGTRTRVTAVKGRCPRPLDDGAAAFDDCLRPRDAIQ